MKRQIYKYHFQKLFSFVFCVGLLSCLTIAAQETAAVSKSNLTAAVLPANAARLSDESVPAEVGQALAKLVASGGDGITQGESEVLAWTNGYKKSNAPALLRQLTGNLQTAGWTYEVGGENQGVTVFSLFRAAPQKRAVIGFYTYSDDALVVAWTEMLLANAGSQTVSKNDSRSSSISSDTNSNSRTNNSSAKIINVGKTDGYVNVMGNEMPAMPQFPALKTKAGFVRGYVKDWTGKPIQGAAIGVRGSYFAGSYSGAQGTTDAKGYYEFAVPQGSMNFYNAGYTMDWGDGIAAVSLHPADGTIGGFSSADGAVENFVLLPYGITSRENVGENPHLASSYYGGSIYIGYSAFEAGDNYPPAYAVPENSVIEITLTSEGEMPGGAAPQSFVVRKIAGFQSGFKINNLPLGRYQISAKINGLPLKMKLNKPRSTAFGMLPNETTGTAEILFAPADAKASMVVPQHGGWNSVEISIARF